MTANFTLEMHELSKRYGDRVVLHVDGLSLPSSRSYALVGPNGSGKSTFLKVLSGVAEQSGGYVEALREGRDVTAELAVGYMPQNSFTFGFSVFKNVAMALDGSGLSRDEVQGRVNRALEEVGMIDFVRARGSGLSGGEAQRVALARMLVRDLDVLMLDEPTASMDIAGTLMVEQALARYRERTGCLLIVATHAPSQARRIADDAVMLSAGRVVEFGPAERVFSNPESDDGKAFLSYWSL